MKILLFLQPLASSGLWNKWHFKTFQWPWVFQISMPNSYSLSKMSQLAKNWPVPGNIQSSRTFLEVSRNDKILRFLVENQVSWHKLRGIKTLHVEISQNQPILGHYWNPEILDSSVQKSWHISYPMCKKSIQICDLG